MKNTAVLHTMAIFVFASGCTVGPKYQRASAPVPAKWDVSEPWRESAPKDAVTKGDWWGVFHDEELNALEKQTLDANQTIKIAAAHLEQARASAAVQIATQFPTLSTAATAQRQRAITLHPASTGAVALAPVTVNNFSLPFQAGYEVDLFGRRRRSIEAAEAAYQASAADLENVRLVITSELAGDYFTVRQLDAELGILNRTVETLEKGLQLVDSRHKGGVASGLDVAQEETLLNTTRTQAILLQQQRKQFEDAIAVLLGKLAPDFHLAPKELNAEPPALDPGLPSDLLERRPDIAEAERQMAAANAQIGIARAAYFPSLNLFANGGWQATDIAKLLNVQSTVWAVGADAAEAIFTGGSRRAQTQFAKAGYDATVAGYRNTVLSAFGEVQDDVTGLMVLDQAFHSQEQAVDAARRTLNISTDRYTGGLVSYLDVVTAQQTLLNNEQQLAVIRGQRLVTSVLLIKA
ncbi:MAG TPA: efflux transporter outer membrane subunit, partial [Candidatus Acidoferrum sp.]